MNKRRLMQCRHIVKEEQEIREQVERLEAKCQGGSVIISDMPRGGVPPDLLPKLIDLRLRFENARAKLLQEIAEIEDYIESIPDSAARRVFRLRYIEAMSWRSIARKMDYTERWLKKKHDASLKGHFSSL